MHGFQTYFIKSEKSQNSFINAEVRHTRNYMVILLHSLQMSCSGLTYQNYKLFKYYKI
jgi:hypothetical protein